MKKIAICILVTCLSLTFNPFQSFAATNDAATSIVVLKPIESEEANALLKRLNEINALDKSNLTSSEKKKLRKEVRATSSHLREVGGGVYLSAGAILIIVLLLIILF
jgi:hypothetical protein